MLYKIEKVQYWLTILLKMSIHSKNH